MADIKIHTPASEEEAAQIVNDARAQGRKLAIQGAGSKNFIGQSGVMADTLSSSSISGIVEYNPAELVFVAKAGTPLPDITAALDENNQMLVFEPGNWSCLVGAPKAQTIGGIAATNMSGPRRILTGAARDSLLGVRFVNGTGEIIKNGGRVMKNVTGLDLVKLLAGSWGTLGFITEVSFKVLPKPETQSTLVVHGVDGEAATKVLAQAMKTSAEVSGSAYLPDCNLVADLSAGGAAALLRLEGFRESIDERVGRLKTVLSAKLDITQIDGDASAAIWRALADCTPFSAAQEKPLWRISAAPSQGHKIARTILDKQSGKYFSDWQGGLIWLQLDATDNAHADLVRETLTRHGGGHALLVRADDAIRASVRVFHPDSLGVALMTQGVTTAIDPDGVFDAGRRMTAQASKAA